MKRLIVLLVAVCMFYPVLSLAGERENPAADPAADAAKINNTKSNIDRRGGAANEATTVKGSKSNSSERVGGAANDATTVKGSKSNSDN